MSSWETESGADNSSLTSWVLSRCWAGWLLQKHKERMRNCLFIVADLQQPVQMRCVYVFSKKSNFQVCKWWLLRYESDRFLFGRDKNRCDWNSSSYRPASPALRVEGAESNPSCQWMKVGLHFLVVLIHNYHQLTLTFQRASEAGLWGEPEEQRWHRHTLVNPTFQYTLAPSVLLGHPADHRLLPKWIKVPLLDCTGNTSTGLKYAQIN